MVQLAAFYGEWVWKDLSWQFVVDNRKGGRMFFLSDGCTHGELVEMAQEDYQLDKKTEVVELTYSLPDSMLQQMAPDTPPTHVTNDRQVRNLVELGRTHVVRLCVSSRFYLDSSKVNGQAYGDCDEEDVDEEDADDGKSEDVDDDEDGEYEDVDDDENASVKVKDELPAYSDDEDYIVYGKVKDEDEEDYMIDGERVNLRCFGEGGISNMKWSDNIFVKQSFASKDELVAELRLTAIMLKYAFKVYKSTPTLFVAKCRVKGCKWMIRASVKNEAKTFWVTKDLKDHTYSVADRFAHRRHSTPKYIGRLFIERVGLIDGIVPQHIRDSMKAMFGLMLDYTTSYRALLHAQEFVRGSAEDGYANLFPYLHQIEKANPGTVTGLEVDEHHRFKYLFIAFGASIATIQYLRRVIVVDGTHLSGKYGGVMLVAAAEDGNFQIFPLAFGIVDSENEDSWEWFFTKLSSCITNQYPLVIVSDRNPSIKKACEKVLPWATRGICYYHLQHNIVTKFHGKHLLYLVKGAAYAFTLHDFNRYMNNIRNINPELATYLEDADVRLWSRVHCQGDRYNIKTNNIAESINSALKRARGFPIVFLLEYIREKLGRWFYKRRQDALSLTTRHSRGVEYLLAVREHFADDMNVERIDGWRYHVRGGSRDWVVDLEQNKCTCGVFDVEKIPCSHAIAAAAEAQLHVATLVYPAYAKDYLYATYSQNIYPRNSNIQAPDVTVQVLPPEVKRQPGRKKKSRWQTWLEMSRRKRDMPRKMNKHYNCSKCKKPGHTRGKCVWKDGEKL